MESMENTLGSIEDSLYRGKAMRSIIMWESQSFYRLGIESFKKFEAELLVIISSNIDRNPITYKCFESTETNSFLNSLLIDSSLRISAFRVNLLTVSQLLLPRLWRLGLRRRREIRTGRAKPGNHSIS